MAYELSQVSSRSFQEGPSTVETRDLLCGLDSVEPQLDAIPTGAWRWSTSLNACRQGWLVRPEPVGGRERVALIVRGRA